MERLKWAGFNLHMCAVDGSRKVYFRATRSKFRYAPNCLFRARNDEFDADQFDETKFVFENAVGRLCTCEEAVKTHA